MEAISLMVSVPFCSFRKPYAREFFETERIPPPATVYGFLLSLIGEEDLAFLGSTEPVVSTADSSKTLKQSIESAERAAILKALSDSNWVINRAADSLGISRKTLWEKMKRYDIEK